MRAPPKAPVHSDLRCQAVVASMLQKTFQRSQACNFVDSIYQDSNSITQSELMRMMNDNSKDEEIQVGNYSSYIPTESAHGPRHA